MIGLIQRVGHASVTVDNIEIAHIGAGILLLLGVAKGDALENAQKLATKLLNFRIFPDAAGKLNVNVQDFGGEILIVSQFTLAANTQKGNRPGFDTAMPPAPAERLYEAFCSEVAARYPKVQTGRFGADMQVDLCNDGPLTFYLNL